METAKEGYNKGSIFLHQKQSDRSGLLDSLRGLTVINMIFFHGLWDWIHLFDIQAEWFSGTLAFLWQQAICCTFILLSGFCGAMGKRALQRGLIVLGLGWIITAITLRFTPEEAIWFGVLSLIGSCMVLVGAMKPILQKVPVYAGIFASFLLFLFTRGVNQGYIGLLFWKWMELPQGFYRNYVTTYLGFPFDGFYSSDYFSLIPWVFLFLCGFYLYGSKGTAVLSVKWKGFSPLNLIGRHALLLYVLHQPVLYGLMMVCKSLMGGASFC